MKQVRPQTSSNLTVQRWGAYIAKGGQVKLNHRATKIGRDFFKQVLVPLATAIDKEVERRTNKTGLRTYTIGSLTIEHWPVRPSRTSSGSHGVSH